MADENTTENVETPADGADKPNPKSGGGKLKVLILVAVAMIGEAGLFYFLGIGGGGQTGEAAAAEEELKPEMTEEDKAADELTEVEVHSFNVTNSTAASDSIVHVSFKLHALVTTDQKDAFDEAANTNNKARVRQAVEQTARSATLEDLSDPKHSTLKRLLREEINKVLRQSFVVEVIISDFKKMEQ